MLEDASTETLLRRAGEGDEAALGQLLESHRQRAMVKIARFRAPLLFHLTPETFRQQCTTSVDSLPLPIGPRNGPRKTVWRDGGACGGNCESRRDGPIEAQGQAM